MSSEVVQAVRDGLVSITWGEIQLSYGAFDTRLNVMCQPASLNGFYPMVTAQEAQEVADLLDASLPTPTILDLIHLSHETQAVEPVVSVGRRIVALMSPIEYAPILKAGITQALVSGKKFLSGGWKFWALDAWVGVDNMEVPIKERWGLRTACNHGWYSRTAPYSSYAAGVRLAAWQSQGHRHNDIHEDASQLLAGLVQQDAQVRFRGGPWVDKRVEDILKDRTFAKAISNTGVLQFTRMPAVPLMVDTVRL